MRDERDDDPVIRERDSLGWLQAASRIVRYWRHWRHLRRNSRESVNVCASRLRVIVASSRFLRLRENLSSGRNSPANQAEHWPVSLTHQTPPHSPTHPLTHSHSTKNSRSSAATTLPWVMLNCGIPLRPRPSLYALIFSFLAILSVHPPVPRTTPVYHPLYLRPSAALQVLFPSAMIL